MILLQTLSRLHVCATLAGAQLLGSVVVMIARCAVFTEMPITLLTSLSEPLLRTRLDQGMYSPTPPSGI
jgi:hypothetical protein